MGLKSNTEAVHSPPDDDGFSSDSYTSSNDILVSPSRDKSTPRVQVRHPRYYIKDDTTVFLVNGEILFCVHRHYLDRESEIFRSYRTGTDENPVPLPDVPPEEFEALVEYFYDSVHGDITKSREEWTLLLSISTRFKMEKVRNRAIREISHFELDAVDKIVLAVNHDVPAWLMPAYVVLCQREEPIREEEAEKLGLSVMVKLARARESVRDSSQVLTPGTPQSTVSLRGPNHFYTTSLRCVEEPNRSRSPSPKPTRSNTAHVERIVTEVFWPPPGSPRSRRQSFDSVTSAGKSL